MSIHDNLSYIFSLLSVDSPSSSSDEIHLIICCTLICQLQLYIAGFVYIKTNPIRPIRCHVDCLNPHAHPNGSALMNRNVLNLEIFRYSIRDIPFKNMFWKNKHIWIPYMWSLSMIAEKQQVLQPSC